MQKQFLFILLISFLLLGCRSDVAPGSYRAKRYNIEKADTLLRDTIVSAYIEKYRNQLSEEMNEVIGHASQLMYRGKPESPLTNFVADFLLENAADYKSTIGEEIKPDIALVNVYGFRNSIPEGAITRGTIFEVMPFDNRIVFSYLRGDAFMQLCEKIAMNGGEGISGMRLSFKDKKLSNATIGGKPINDTLLYCIVTSDYLADGGGGLSILKKAEKVVQTEVLLRDAIIDKIVSLRKENKSVLAQLDKRIYVE